MRIQNLFFSFNQAQENRARNNVDSLAAQAGDTYFFKNMSVNFVPDSVNFILGDNGVGKSTLFSILRGVNSASTQLSGSVELGDAVYAASHNQLPAAFAQQVHMVHQQYDTMLAQECSYKENLQLAALSRYPRLAPLPATVFSIDVAQFDIDPDKPVYLLSGGQRQLLAILMALQKPTKLLLLDEPTATLDSANARLIMDLLQQLARQLSITILVICHDTALVKQYAREGASVLLQRGEHGTREMAKVDVHT